jgi:hypothetical protein
MRPREAVKGRIHRAEAIGSLLRKLAVLRIITTGFKGIQGERAGAVVNYLHPDKKFPV